MASTIQSLFGDMFKTPAQMVQEQQQKLMEQGRQSAGMMLAAAPKSGLAQAIAGHAAGIAQNMPATQEALRRTALGGMGLAAGALDQQQLQNLYYEGAMTPEERAAAANQKIIAETDQNNLYSVKAARDKFKAAGNAKGVMMMEQQIAALQKRNLDRASTKREEMRQIEELNLKKKAEERLQSRLEFDKGKETTDALKPQSTEGKFAADEGYKPGTESFQNRVLALRMGADQPATNQRWATNKETNESILVGDVGGKLVQITPEGNIPAPKNLAPVKQVTKVENYADAMTQLGNQANQLFTKDKDRLEGIKEMQLGLREVKAGNEQGVNTLARSLVKIAGPDGTISKAEVEGVLGQGDIATRVANAFSVGIKGVPTQQTLEDIGAFVSAYQKEISRRLATKVRNWKEGYSELGGDVSTAADNISKQYMPDYSSSAQKYIQQARGQ